MSNLVLSVFDTSEDFSARASNVEGKSFSSISHDYLPEPNAGPISFNCRLTEDQIHAAISKRLQCKRKREFDAADKILAGLNEGGVYVHDKRKEWRADGLNHFGRSGYTRRGGTYGLSDEAIRAVSQMVEDRSYAKKRKEFHISDELAEKLKTKYQVKVNDKNREWSVVVNNWDGEEGNGLGGYVPSPLAPPEDPTHTMDDALKARIAHLLASRVAFRKKKDYKTADKIRDELIEQYSIVIDDRTREWKVVLGDSKYDNFAMDAQLSQRSAFVRRESSENETTKHREITTQSVQESDDTTLPNGEDVGVNQMDLESLTVVELKEQLRQAGLPVSGKKADLILRLNSQ